MSERFRVQLLGGFEVRRAGQLLPLPSASQRLVASLAIDGAKWSRDRLAARLWPDASRDHAAGNLRTTLWRLRPAGAALMDRGRDHLRLADDVDVDVHAIIGFGGPLVTGPRCAVPDQRSPLDAGFLEAVSRLAAPLLPDWDDEWVRFERERMRQSQLHALEQLAETASLRGVPARAVEAALMAVKLEPLRESAHRVLVRAHLAEGNVAEALRQYERFHQLLDEELGLPPTLAFQNLVAPIRGSMLERRHDHAASRGPRAACPACDARPRQRSGRRPAELRAPAQPPG